ncbi:MAG: response regulator [Chloroflexi bacterium]|nr:MAG: response regulator [Chloroflexota bacterium]MBL1195849.1 response regulator [Chloroflexota bacterium]NOH13141.1 response regulator [Chloroflexota bacterium]
MPKVLLVEDDPTMRELLETLLGFEGFEVDSVRDYAHSYERISEVKPDVVLMDVYLRDSNGLEILERVRAEEDLNGIRVIMSSGMEHSSECYQKGADDFILKPYMPDELITRIKKLL